MNQCYRAEQKYYILYLYILFTSHKYCVIKLDRNAGVVPWVESSLLEQTLDNCKQI